MSKDKHIIRDLDSEIKKVQIVHKYEKWGNRDKRITSIKDIIPLLRRQIRKIKPVTWFIIIALNYFFPGIFMLLCSVLMLSGTVFLNAIIDYENIIDNRALEELDKVRIRKPEEYYREEFRYATALYNYESEDDKKYKAALEKQNKNKPKKEEEVSYTKDDEINLLVEGIEDYFYCYKLPPLRVRDYEWDAFFDTIYREFKIRGIKGKFYHATSEVIRYTLANILVDQKGEVRIGDFINNLEYLCETSTNMGILPEYFNLDEVYDIQSTINLKIKNKRRKEVKRYNKII